MLYAKSNPAESIQEHTDKLIENMEILEKIYGDRILQNKEFTKDRFFELLRLSCLYHDIGKVYIPFQNKILRALDMDEIKTQLSYSYIKHEQISPIFIPFEELRLNKDERKILIQAIYFHHERDNNLIPKEILEKVINEDIRPRIHEIQKELNMKLSENLSNLYLPKVNVRINSNDNLFIEYCLLKGLLNRIDHASSANIIIENESKKSLKECTEKYLIEEYKCINKLQEFTKNNQGENIIVIGSTGIGKTEAALLWSGNEKVFFTLPIRISINAIYDRIIDLIGYNEVALLHSTALEYLEDKHSEEEIKKYEESKNLASKVTTCTIDQIFPFVFKYKGYEKIYSTFSYSNIIIDEIQAYNPEIVAVILKGLEMINKIGGKFMLMTATLPRIYKDELNKMGITFKSGEFLKEIERHKIKIENNSIESNIEKILKNGKDNKVLIIVNTVNKAIDIYKMLKNNELNINLFHSRFILRDRNKKENEIKIFSKDRSKNGIWITTQIVEASLDIDFDYLYTEMSTLDSLFQRLGRCYRSRTYDKNEANVFIYTQKISGINSVYDKDIHEKSIDLLNGYNGQILFEKDKIKLVDLLYSKEMLEGTNFLKQFKNGMKILNELLDYSTEKSDAQKLLRNIDNITVIPQRIYNENLDLFKNYENEENVSKKYEYKREINKLTLNISKGQSWKFKDKISINPYIDNISIINLDYNNNIGLILNNDEEYSLNDRFGDV